ncbi:M48 family metallopeptidase [Bacillus safensis]|uniref:M48 family metallopeptidase n=1 Tax=Bacillus safensis TaxID=561879 RepID=UPI000B44A962|nr:SprT family zinc-dependent metalloprotease [Bacillus safensis]PAK34771.1 M48 family peptidase [Bacillus safensis]UDB50099.1 M48 family metallopeptidase [Bacillus safensis]
MDIQYEIKYSNRKTVNISVERDRSVIVRAPQGVSEDKINYIVKSKRDWIIDKMNHKQKYPAKPEPKEFVSGETILYLGKNYQLTVVDDIFDGVEFNQRFTISRANQKEANKLFKDWFYERAFLKIEPKVKFYAQQLGVKYKQVKISDMKYRWGSCTPNNNVIFNWRLIKAPMYVVEYLIVHELAHLIEPNHTPEFWNIVSIQIPQYEEAKTWLKQHGYLLEVEF